VCVEVLLPRRCTAAVLHTAIGGLECGCHDDRQALLCGVEDSGVAGICRQVGPLPWVLLQIKQAVALGAREKGEEGKRRRGEGEEQRFTACWRRPGGLGRSG